MNRAARPSAAELEAARDKTVPDVIAPDLKVLFCGINPSLYTAAVGHHFARPGNRFWPALHGAGFTPRLFDPREEAELLAYGYGVTNVVPRATAAASELTREDYARADARLRALLCRYRPRVLAVLGIGAYREAFADRRARMGPQPERVEGVEVWVLPNPSGLNANHQLPELIRLFTALRLRAEALAGRA